MNEPVVLYFLNSFGANQRLLIHLSMASLAVVSSTWNGSTPSTARRAGASWTSSRWIGVAQYGQRMAVRLPLKVVWPPQFWQTISFSASAARGRRRPVERTAAASAASAPRKSCSSDLPAGVVDDVLRCCRSAGT